MKHRSKFLVIVDDSEELNVAIRFAAKRAQSTKGGVTLLNVIEQFDPQQWQSIEDIILQEAREKAQEKLQKWSKVINDLTNIVPELMIKEGTTSEKIIETLEEDNAIRFLVLAALSQISRTTCITFGRTKIWKITCAYCYNSTRTFRRANR